jgi:hypothetical protein
MSSTPTLLRRYTKQALFEELLDPKTMTIRQRGDYGTGVEPNVGEVSVAHTTDQLAASSSEPADTYGVSAVPRGGILR